MKKAALFIVSLTLLITLFSCASTKSVEMNYMDYITANKNSFFMTGKTDYTVEAKMVSEPTHIFNKLELVNYDVTDDNVSVILKGSLGEEWVTKVSKVINTYTTVDGSELSEDFFTSHKNEYQTIKTKPAKNANFALFVPKNTVLTVETAWGDTLYTNKSEVDHAKGDYLVCRNNNGEPDLTDVWVVNGAQFRVNYDLTNAK